MILTADLIIAVMNRYYAPPWSDGVPWCAFTRGSLDCVNGDTCLNPNHRKRSTP